MRRLACLAFVALLSAPAWGDALLLNNSRRIIGKVKEHPSHYEITVEGQVLVFAKEDVARWIKTPHEIVNEADKHIEGAKQYYTEATTFKGSMGSLLLDEALLRLGFARDAYAEAREIFPEGYPELDKKLMEIMQLMRLIRDARGGLPSGRPPESPPATPAAPSARPEAPKSVLPPPAPAGPIIAPELLLPPAPEAAPDAELVRKALSTLADPARRGDAKGREEARAIFARAWNAGGTGAELCAAACVFLGRDEKDWGLVRGPERVRTPAFEPLQGYLSSFCAQPPELLAEADLSQGAQFLAAGIAGLRGSDPSARLEAHALFVSALASELLVRKGAAGEAELQAVFKHLGVRRSTYGLLWGRPESLAADDFRKWVESGEYGLGVVQFHGEHRALPAYDVRYAHGLLLMLKALKENRGYAAAAAHFELLARSTTGQPGEHAAALAKSIRSGSPCSACAGTGKVNCSACRGKTKLNLICTTCGGSGKKIQAFGGGTIACPGCKGQGVFRDVECPKCKAGGTAPCKARACAGEVARPALENFASAASCGLCRGRGSIMRHVAYACPQCLGIGLRFTPKADPTKTLK